MTAIPWRAAMTRALYGPSGFFVRPDAPGASGHFRTSASSSPLLGTALLRLLAFVDEELGRPDPLRVVDVGAGRGQLLRHLCAQASGDLADRLSLVAVELAPPPADLPPAIEWRHDLPAPGPGLLIATEWLDNVPLDLAEVDGAGDARYLLVDPASGEQTLGPRLTDADSAWASRWWPTHDPGVRLELGAPRDAAWAAAVQVVSRGLALTVDYGHMRGARPLLGTLTGYRDGWSVEPVPDGSCDLTVHVAMDAVCAAGGPAAVGAAGDTVAVCAAGGGAGVLTDQRTALRALGVDGGRPPIALASVDPAGYVRALAEASAAADLLDAGGLGGHFWLLQAVGIGLPSWA